MDEEINRQVFIMESGDQVPVEADAGVVVGFFIAGDKVKDQVTLDVSQEEFAKIQEQAVTNDIPDAILQNRKAPEIDLG